MLSYAKQLLPVAPYLLYRHECGIDLKYLQISQTSPLRFEKQSFQELCLKKKILDELLLLQPPLRYDILFVYKLKNQLKFCV